MENYTLIYICHHMSTIYHRSCSNHEENPFTRRFHGLHDRIRAAKASRRLAESHTEIPV